MGHVLVHFERSIRDDGSFVVRVDDELSHRESSKLAVSRSDVVLGFSGESGDEEASVLEVRENDRLERDEDSILHRRRSHHESQVAFSILVASRKIDRDPSVLLHVDPELLDPRPLLLDVLSDDEDARLRVEELDPISSSEDGDGVVEEREGDLGDGFADEEEVRGVLKGSGRGEGSGELIASEGEEEDSFDDLRGSSREREGRDGG